MKARTVFLSILVALSITTITGTHTSAAEKYVLFVLDTSGSMKGEKIEMAKSVLLEMLKHRPKNTEIVLRVFNQNAERKEVCCHDSELLLDFSDHDVDVFKKILEGIRVFGRTPLARTIENCFYDFFEREKENVIIVITDGQDTCGGDPCGKAAYLRNYGIVIHVIALDVEMPYRKGLMCIPESTGGEYFDVFNQPELLKSVSGLLGIPTSPLVVILKNNAGKKVSGHITIYDYYGDVVATTSEPLREFSPTLPIGEYSVTAEVDGEIKEIDKIKLEENKVTEITVLF